MGRITIFSTNECSHCMRVKGALILRRIPFVEIDLVAYPARRNDMLSLTSKLSIPQVFFNDRFIGGADELLFLLQEWDQNERASPLQLYQQLVASIEDPSDERLREPSADEQAASKEAPSRSNSFCLRGREEELCVKLPNGEVTSVLQIQLTLESILDLADRPFNAHTYKSCFVNDEGVTAIAEHYDISRQAAVEFGRYLQNEHELLHHVCDDHEFRDDGYYFFRLQCHHQPDVLNSFCVWKHAVNPNCANAILLKLKQLLHKVLSNATDHNGLVDYTQARQDEHYPILQEALCELQAVDMLQMNEATRLAFGLNLYNLMISFAFIQVGIGTSSMTRSAFFSKVKMNIGGHLLSFNDLENGILRANTRHPYAMSVPFGASDARLPLSLSKLDCRVHFALNCGAKSCPPVKYFHADSVQEELRVVACAFCELDETIGLDEAKNEMHLSMLLKWFQADFCESSKELPQALLEFLLGEKKETLQRMIDKADRNNKPITLKYHTYDWSANASAFESFKTSTLIANELTPTVLVTCSKAKKPSTPPQRRVSTIEREVVTTTVLTQQGEGSTAELEVTAATPVAAAS